MNKPVRSHEALLIASTGYRLFIADELASARELEEITGGNSHWETDRESLLVSFADWLILPHEATEYMAWTADQFRERWEHWNS